MIIKSYEIDKINKDITNFYLFYGKNKGLKKELAEYVLKEEKNIINYDEKEMKARPFRALTCCRSSLARALR